jgi:hypothetical protein
MLIVLDTGQTRVGGGQRPDAVEAHFLADHAGAGQQGEEAAADAKAKNRLQRR